MNLRSNDLYWPNTCPRPNLDTSWGRARSVRLDVVIIGAGITGAFAAHELTLAGAKVAVLDRREIASGSTPASSALVLYELDTPLVYLRRKLSRAHADAAYARSYESVRQIERLAARLKGPIEFARRQSLYLARSSRDLALLRREARARQRLGIDARFINQKMLLNSYGIRRPGAILNQVAAEVNPLALTYSLLISARKRGALIKSHCDVDLSGLDLAATPFRLKLDRSEIVADRLVIATGYESIPEFAGLGKLTELRSTFAIATQPLADMPWPHRMLLWETGNNYLYARTTSDNRLIIGGEDELLTEPQERDLLIARKSEILLAKLKRTCPHLSAHAAYAWAGTFTMTKDGRPFIGSHHHWPHVFFALGYGGNGITFSFLAAKILATAFRGKPHPAAQLFRFDR